MIQKNNIQIKTVAHKNYDLFIYLSLNSTVASAHLSEIIMSIGY